MVSFFYLFYSVIREKWATFRIEKKVLTNACDGGIITKLSRETKVKRKTQNLENCIIRQCAASIFGEFTESFDRSVSLLKKISKNFEKST